MTPRPRPFLRFSRADYEQLLDGLYDQRDFAIGQARATKDRVAAMLEARADAYLADAKHLEKLGAKSPLTAEQRRAIADELRDVARDVHEDVLVPATSEESA